MKRLLKNIAGFGGGYRRISRRERWRAFRRRMCIHTTTSAKGFLRPATKAGIQLYYEAKSDGHPSQETNIQSLDNVHDANDQPTCDRANNCDLRVSKVRGQDRHTSCPGSRAGAPVCQRANPAAAVICYLWCRAVGFIRAAVGCVCAVGLSCAVCLLAMWLKVWLQDDIYMCHDTSTLLPVTRDSASYLPIGTPGHNRFGNASTDRHCPPQ